MPKVLLESIHRTSKLSEISGYGMDNLLLINGLWEHYIRKQVTKEQESSCTMENVFKRISHVTMLEERSKAYHQPEYDSGSPVSIKKMHETCMPNRYVTTRTILPNWTYSSTQHNPQSSSTFNNVHKSSGIQYNRDQRRLQYNCLTINLKCYYCEGDHCLENCNKFSRDKAKCKLKSADMFRKCKDKITQHAKKENMSTNEAAFTTA